MSNQPDQVQPSQKSRRISQLRALNHIASAMTSTLNPTAIMETVLTEVMTLTKAQCATIFIVEQDTQLLIPRVSHLEPEPRQPLDLQISNDLAVEVAHTGKIEQHVHKGQPCQGGCSVETLINDPDSNETFCRLCVPLVAGDVVLGVIDLQAGHCRGYEQDMQEFLATLSSQAALVLRNAKIHEELEQHYNELTLLYEIQQEIASTLEYEKVLNLIVQRTLTLLDARECTIRLFEEWDGKHIVRVAATTGRHFIGPSILPIEQTIIDQQVFGGELIAIEDVRVDPRFQSREDAQRSGIVSLLCAPLVARRKVIGSIRLYTGERRDFNLSDRKMLLAIAGQAATAIDNARLYTEVEIKNRALVASNAELRRTQKELVKKEKLAALGEMAATVAHEIRNPLTSVRGFAQRIARKYPDHGDSRLQDYTGIIIEEVDRLNKFIKDVLDFARRAKPEYDRINLNLVLGELLNFMRDELAANNIMAVPDLDANLPEIIGDENLLKQALLNILQNARQAMGKGGILMIRTQSRADTVRIRIVDDGHGIPREILQKIWTPFYTTKTQGTGLGLSLVQRIIDDHGGDVNVRSRVGTGTVVDITLPVNVDPEELLTRGAQLVQAR